MNIDKQMSIKNHMSISNKTDYRSLIVLKKKNANYWKNWNNWNSLYKTLAYELSSSGHVESYEYVKKDVLALLNVDEKYEAKEIKLDIMNGWWYCFKIIFEVGSRGSDETKKFMKKLMESIENKTEKELIEFIYESYKVKKELIILLLKFLNVVYTIGNICPVTRNIRADSLDSWEYKLYMYQHNEDINIEKYKNDFVIIDYPNRKWWDELNNKNKCDVIKDYMDTRVDLINKRTESIFQKNNQTKLYNINNLPISYI